MSNSTYDERAAKHFGEQQFKEVTVEGFPAAAVDVMSDLMSSWYDAKAAYKRFRRSGQFQSDDYWAAINRLEVELEASNITLVLRSKTTRLKPTITEKAKLTANVEIIDELVEIQLTPKTLVVSPDGSFVFTGVHQDTYLRGHGYGNLPDTGQRYTEYHVSVAADGTTTFIIGEVIEH